MDIASLKFYNMLKQNSIKEFIRITKKLIEISRLIIMK